MGTAAELVALADESVAVPIYGRAESLNLAAAAAVCLYASARAQRAHSEGGTGQGVRGAEPPVRGEGGQGDKMVRKLTDGGLEYLVNNMENSRLRTVTKPVYALESDHNPSPKP